MIPNINDQNQLLLQKLMNDEIQRCEKNIIDGLSECYDISTISVKECLGMGKKKQNIGTCI